LCEFVDQTLALFFSLIQIHPMAAVRGDVEGRSRRPGSVIRETPNPNVVDVMQRLNWIAEQEETADLNDVEDDVEF
jgi:hypothetical protein